MKLNVAYGCGEQVLELPDTCKVEVLEGKEAKDVDEGRMIRKAWENPLDSQSIDEFLDGGKLLIFTNDGDRPTPTWQMLEPIIDSIRDRPDTKILVGCGTHRVPNKDDYELIFGKYYEVLKDKIDYHVAKDEANLVRIGTTKRGNEVYMNKLVDWADKLLITGSVEPHYFAGFTGGRKWVIGAGGFWTIERNHKMALGDEAATLALDGNPIHEELVEWDRMVKKDKFCINVVQDKHLKVGACFAGDMDRVFEECVKVGLDMYSSETEGEGDIVITVSRAPQDSNLYQALKAQEHGKLAMRKGGILILVAECRLGLGPKHFGEMLQGTTPKELLKNIETQFHLGHHKIAKLLNTLMNGRVWVVTDLPAEDVAAVQMEKFSSIQEAVDKALGVVGKDAKVIYIPDGGMTVPKVVEAGMASMGAPLQRIADVGRLARRIATKTVDRIAKKVEKGIGTKETRREAVKKVTEVARDTATRGTKVARKVARRAVKKGRKVAKKAVKRAAKRGRKAARKAVKRASRKVLRKGARKAVRRKLGRRLARKAGRKARKAAARGRKVARKAVRKGAKKAKRGAKRTVRKGMKRARTAARKGKGKAAVRKKGGKRRK